MRLGLALALCVTLPACSPEARPKPVAATCGLKSAQIGQFVTIPSGSFVAGASPFYPEEGPPQNSRVEGFSIQTHEVTNDQFASFVRATGHVTDAERTSASGQADGGSGVFVRGSLGAGKPGDWRLTKNATWRTPEGPGSNIDGKGIWPVVHVSHRDALAYAAWYKARLPTEIEWEYAAQLGLPDADNSRSGGYDKSGKPVSNTWQGIFPLKDEASDGFEGAAPVGCFPASKIGTYDLIGNLWEWTAQTDPNTKQAIIKGGSHLCSDNFCGRYRPEAKQWQDVDFSTNHIGFRVVRDGE